MIIRTLSQKRGIIALYDGSKPYTEDGDVYIAETSIEEDDDLNELFKYFVKEADNIKNLYNEEVLTI